MAYRCGQAIIGRAEEPIRCKVSGTVCAHQKMCLMEGRIVLTDGALECPARYGKIPDQVAFRLPPETPSEDAGTKKPAAKKPAKKGAKAK